MNSEKISYIMNYYKGRPESITNIKFTDKGNTVIIQDYDNDIEIQKSNVKVIILGGFIINCYDVFFVNYTDKDNYDYIGIPLAIGIGGYYKAREYAQKGTDALGYKFLEDGLLLSISLIDKNYFV